MADILLVDDSRQDVELTKECIARARLGVNLHHVWNGEECLAFLRGEGQYEDAPTPDLVLLDLNMPVMDGREVLAEIVKDDELRHLPIVVLTTSSAEQDIIEMYRLRCNAYATKPVDFEEFVKVVRELATFWFDVAELPPASAIRPGSSPAREPPLD